MIVNSAVYRHGVKTGDVELSEISEVLKDPDTFVWLGLYEPELDELKRMQAEFCLHDLAIEDALNAHQRPKLEAYGETLFIVLDTVQLVDGDPKVGETHLFLGRNFIVGVRHGASSSYAELRRKCEAEPDRLALGPAYVLYAITDFVVDNLDEVAQRLEQRFEDLERDIFNDTFDRSAIEKLYELKSRLLRLRGIVLPVQDICSQLRLHEKLVPKDLRAYFRDVEDHVTRIVNVLDVIREMLTTAIQVNLALVTVTQNEVVKRLAGWGAVLAIPTVVFSLYGMNFQNMPELKWPYAYPVVVGGTVLACAALFARLRRAGWL